VIAPGVIDEAVLLQTLKLTLPAVGHENMVSIPVVDGTYPVTAVGSPLNDAVTTSVVAVPVAVAVTVVAQAALAIAPIPIAEAPDAIVCVSVAADEGNVCVFPPIWNVPVKFAVPDCVNPPLLRGTVAPDVPVFTVQTVPALKMSAHAG
jgi:hypothetical protein